MLTYDIEGMYQDGTFESDRIRAYSVVGRINYNFSENNLLQRVSFVLQSVSGDKGNANELNTFNPLYSRVYYGLGVPYWPSNIQQFTPSADLRLSKKLFLSGDVHFLWRQNIHDGLYLVVPTRSPDNYGSNTLSQQKYIGTQQDVSLTYNITRYWYADVQFTYLPVSGYVESTGYGKSIFFSLLETKFRF